MNRRSFFASVAALFVNAAAAPWRVIPLAPVPDRILTRYCSPALPVALRGDNIYPLRAGGPVIYQRVISDGHCHWFHDNSPVC